MLQSRIHNVLLQPIFPTPVVLDGIELAMELWVGDPALLPPFAGVLSDPSLPQELGERSNNPRITAWSIVRCTGH